MPTPADRPRLAVHVEGRGPRLALLHGGMGSRTHWARNLAALTPHYEVHCLDLPGCGDSDGVAPDIADTEYVAIVCDELARIAAPGRLRVVGFSFGAVISALCAARLGELVERLVLIGPGGFGAATGRRLDLRRIPPGNTDPAVERDVLRHNLLVMMLAHEDSIDDDTLALQKENARRTRFDSRRFSLGDYLLPALAQVRCPVHLVYGEQDNLAWPSVAARVDRVRVQFPQVRIDLVPRGGHWVQYERADEVNRLLLASLSAD